QWFEEDDVLEPHAGDFVAIDILVGAAPEYDPETLQGREAFLRECGQRLKEGTGITFAGIEDSAVEERKLPAFDGAAPGRFGSLEDLRVKAVRNDCQLSIC